MTQNNQLAIVKRNVINMVSDKIRGFQKNNELHLPATYSHENALKSAFLILQNTFDRNKKPVLEVCSQNSIANSLLDMVAQGLNPAKKQCYFIAYGKELACQRSYHGSMAVVKTLCGAIDIFTQVVWGEDEFDYNIERGNKKISNHKQKIQNVGKNPIAAYCVIVFEDGKDYTDIMTMDQIEKAWSKSKMNHRKDGSVHKDFEEEMIRKTVINRACKKYINSSSDNALLIERFNATEESTPEIALEDELSHNANVGIIDIMDQGQDTPQPKNEVPQLLTEAEKDEIISQELADMASSAGPGF